MKKAPIKSVLATIIATAAAINAILIVVSAIRNGWESTKELIDEVATAPLTALHDLYYSYSFPVRFNLFMWIIVFLVYYILSAYDKKINMDNKRDKKVDNFRIRIFVLYTIFLCIGLFVYEPTEHYKVFFDVVGLVVSILGLGVLISARIELNGLWGPDIYVYSHEEYQKVVDTGIYKHMRHPIYFGQMMLSTSTFVLIQNLWTFAFCLFVIVINMLRAHREEQALLELYPDKYSSYKKITKRWWIY